MKFDELSDAELVKQLKDSVKNEKLNQVKLIYLIAIADNRKLYASYAYPSLFTFCTEYLGLSESCAYKRIQVARASRKFPTLLTEFENGRLHLSALATISPHLTQENFKQLLEKAAGLSQRGLEELLLSLGAHIPKKDSIRILPANNAPSDKEKIDLLGKVLPTDSNHVPTTPIINLENANKNSDKTEMHAQVDDKETKIQAIQTEHRAVITFYCSKVLLEKIQRCQNLLRHKFPQGKLEDVFNELCELFLDKKDYKRHNDNKSFLTNESQQKTDKNHKEEYKKHSSSRYIPSSIKRQVYEKCGYQCCYVSHGTRCRATSFLQIDHIKPFSHNGTNRIENLQLLCFTHNQLKAKMQLGFVKRSNNGQEVTV